MLQMINYQLFLVLLGPFDLPMSLMIKKPLKRIQLQPIKAGFSFIKKGCGYVQFVSPQDAIKAISELKKTIFNGKRTLRMEFATRKNSKEGLPANAILDDEGDAKEGEADAAKSDANAAKEEANAATPNATATPPKTTETTKKPFTLHSKVVALTNFPPQVTQKQVYKKVRKFGSVTNITMDPTRILIDYSKREEAANAVSHLNQHVFKGETLAATLVQTLESSKHRLIIRNLNFSVNVEKLKSVFEKIGKTIDVHIPLKEDGNMRGFGFVEYATHEEAEKVILVFISFLLYSFK